VADIKGKEGAIDYTRSALQVVNGKKMCLLKYLTVRVLLLISNSILFLLEIVFFIQEHTFTLNFVENYVVIFLIRVKDIPVISYGGL
jgi:hypothetical protein